MTQTASPSPTPVESGDPSAAATASTQRPRRMPPWLRDALEVLLIAFVLYLIIWTALQTVRVDGTSMVGTLQDQDLLLASKISYQVDIELPFNLKIYVHTGNPSRGDIVILEPPNDTSRDFIKRVIAVPGDVIEIDGSHQPVQVLIKPGGKGAFQVLKEPYLPQAWTTQDYCCTRNGTSTSTPQAVTVPTDEYFVMGDNRNFSSDSRSFGWVPRDNILAKAFLRLWPLNHFGGLGSGPSLTAAPTTTGVMAAPVAAFFLAERSRRRRRLRGGGRCSRGRGAD